MKPTNGYELTRRTHKYARNFVLLVNVKTVILTLNICVLSYVSGSPSSLSNPFPQIKYCSGSLVLACSGQQKQPVSDSAVVDHLKHT